MGAPHEGGPIERLLWRGLSLFRPGILRWTDDTEMSLGLCESIIERGRVDPDHLAKVWAERMTWSRGYGPGAAKTLRRIRAGEPYTAAARAAHPGGSFGNGAAMRSPMLGLHLAGRPEELESAARSAAAVTHAHPLGIEGAVIMARAAALAASGERDVLPVLAASCAEPEFKTRLEEVAEIARSTSHWLQARPHLRSGTAALDSVPTALLLFHRHPMDLNAVLEEAVDLGGDVDTITSMAGSLIGALNGPEVLAFNRFGALEQRERLVAAARALHRASA